MPNRFNGTRSWPILLVAHLLFASMPSGAGIVELIDSSGDMTGNPLGSAAGIVFDEASGNVYVSGLSTHNVFRIAPDGSVVEILDESGDGLGNQLQFPGKLAIDAAGNVFVVSSETENVFRVTPNGDISVILTATGDGMGNLLSFPTDVEVDSSGNVYVSGGFSDNVFRVTPGGVITTVLDSTGDGAGATMGLPVAMTFDSAGNLFVLAVSANSVFRIEPNGEISVAVGLDSPDYPIRAPNDLAVDGQGNIYIANGHLDHNVLRVTPAGIVSEFINPLVGDGNGNLLETPDNLQVDPQGYLYVTGRPLLGGFGSDIVFRVSPTGQLVVIMDETGDGTGNPFHGPLGLVVSSSGDVFVTGKNSNNAFRINATEFAPSLNPGALLILLASLSLAHRYGAQR